MDPDNYYDEQAGELIDYNLAQRRRDILLGLFWPDAQRLNDLETYDPGMWDPSLVTAEVRGTWPKEYTDVER